MSYTRTAANTRRVTNEMREMAHYLQGRVYGLTRAYMDKGNLNAVDTWWEARPYNKTHGSFTVEHQSPTRAGCPVVIYPERGEYWIRPASRGDGSVQLVDKCLREMAAETRYLDVLFDILEAGGWQAMGHSETRETLAAWRDTRRGQI